MGPLRNLLKQVTELALKAEKMEDMSLKPFYTVLGVDLEGRKEILGLYLNEREGAKFGYRY